MSELAEITITVDEFEALRLADFEGLYQEQAAEKMNVSRQTFGRIIASARKKVAQGLVEGSALKIEGGVYRAPQMRTFRCDECGRSWEAPFGTGRPEECPGCGRDDFRRVGGPGRRKKAKPVLED